MDMRAAHGSRIERIASLAAALGLTVGSALLVLTSQGPSFVIVPARVSTIRDAEESERLVFVTPELLTGSLAPARQAAVARRTISPRTIPDTASGSSLPTSLPLAVPVAPPAADSMASTASPARATAGAPDAAATVGFKRPSAPTRFDSVLRVYHNDLAAGLATGRLKAPPATQAERDAKLRDEAFEAIAARGAGAAPRPTAMAGTSIAVPLPFGGPSRKQRERDRALEAELKVGRALRQLKVDSVVAARARRRADSLARIADSLRQGGRLQY